MPRRRFKQGRFKQEWFWIAVAIHGLLHGVAYASDRIEFERDVRPILERNCFECHGPDEQQSGLRLDRRHSMLRGGDTGYPTIVPSAPNESLLLKVISGPDEPELMMPPEGDRLSPSQVDVLRQWIAQGALWPGQMDASPDDVESDLWSLKPLRSFPATPDLSAAIDQWIQLELDQQGLVRSPRADAVTLLRRVSLVLTGLPPTRDAVAEFLSDPRGLQLAYTDAVDELLASPRYGERWAQHWFDVIRWAETVGFETNAERPNAWPYRDWVINAFNEDKPYDQFLFEQIAGDTVGADAALGFLVAGPANLPGQIGRDEEAMRQARQDELDEVINTVSQAALGLTIGCARCHNHKFDPILQRDYYALQAVFAGLKYGNRRWRGDENDRWAEQIPVKQVELNQKIQAAEELREKFKLTPPLNDMHTDHFAPVTARAVRMEISATASGAAASLYEFEAWTHVPDGSDMSPRNVALASNGGRPSASSFALANQTRHFDNVVDGSSDRRQAFPWVARAAGPAWIQIEFERPETIDRTVWDRGSSLPAEYVIRVLTSEAGSEDAWVTVADTSARWPREEDERGPSEVHLDNLALEDITQITRLNKELNSLRATLSKLIAGPQVFSASFDALPEATWLLGRGDPMQRRAVVQPAVPAILGKLDLRPGDEEQQRRIAFARHLIAPKHPLTARVIVNRIWQHHFGEGLVGTPSDFGEMGARPTHPELLDLLATEFMREGWSIKKLHRSIALSQTFQQADGPRDEAMRVDADTRLLWRFPPRRLEAEAIRDSILQASGKLNLKSGGRGFSLFKQRGGLADYQAIESFDEEGWRRMIYAHKVRMQTVDIFGAFDCPDAGQMQPNRTQSTTPSQALSLFNSPFVVRQAEFFATRVRLEVGSDAGEQVLRAFEIALSRKPSASELKYMTELVETSSLDQLCRVLFNSSEFLFLP